MNGSMAIFMGRSVVVLGARPAGRAAAAGAAGLGRGGSGRCGEDPTQAAVAYSAWVFAPVM